MKSGSRRSYQMRKRADNVEQTRQRIIDATVRLHTSVGAAKTTIAGIAEQADVTRATVYKHFADDVELFTACSAQWYAEHPPPDIGPWLEIADFDQRAARMLNDTYAWYAENADDLCVLLRNLDVMPAEIVEQAVAIEATIVDILVGGRDGAVRTVAAHLLAFPTWDSLLTRGARDHHTVVAISCRLLQAMR